MEQKKKKNILIWTIIVGILTVVNIWGFVFGLLITTTGYGFNIEDCVYFKETDLIINYSQDDPTEVESYTIKLVNTSNKEFVDYTVRLTLYVVNGNINHYPHASTSSKTITIKPKEEIQLTLPAGYLQGLDLEGYSGESLELEYLKEKATASTPDIYFQLDNGKDFNHNTQKLVKISTVVSGVTLLICLTVETILLINLFKSKKKLIKTMVKGK